jgi:hypothetical protein
MFDRSFKNARESRLGIADERRGRAATRGGVMSIRLLGLVALLIVSAAPAVVAVEPSWRDFPEVSNSSFVEPSGDRSIQLSALIPAPAGAVFAAFTTSGGFRSWAAPIANVDLRIGVRSRPATPPTAGSEIPAIFAIASLPTCPTGFS